MAQQYSLNVLKRTEAGKGATRKLRRQGYVPGIYYAKNGENFPLAAYYGEMERIYERAHKSNVIYLKIKDGQKDTNKPVLIWDIQFHPVKNLIQHVDFKGVDLTEEVVVDVPLHISGTAKGEDEGGVVSLYRDALRVSCLPTAIPDQISVDVSELDINDNISIDDIRLPEGVELKESEEGFAVVGVSPPAKTEEEELEAAEEGEEAEGEEASPSEEPASGQEQSGEEES
jgi:large subunit ribosomal protein L25